MLKRRPPLLIALLGVVACTFQPKKGSQDSGDFRLSYTREEPAKIAVVYTASTEHELQQLCVQLYRHEPRASCDFGGPTYVAGTEEHCFFDGAMPVKPSQTIAFSYVFPADGSYAAMRTGFRVKYLLPIRSSPSEDHVWFD